MMKLLLFRTEISEVCGEPVCHVDCKQDAKRKRPNFWREISSSNGHVNPTNRVNRRPKTHDFPKPVVKSRKEESASWQHWANIFQKGDPPEALLGVPNIQRAGSPSDWMSRFGCKKSQMFHVDLSHTLSRLQDCQTNCANPTCEWKQLGGAYWWILNYLSIKISTTWNFRRIASTN